MLDADKKMIIPSPATATVVVATRYNIVNRHIIAYLDSMAVEQRNGK
jgi:hypothetical protein